MRSRVIKSCRGFTLMELLFIVVIMSIAMAIVMPSLVRSIRGHRLRTASHTLVTVARYARSMAVLKQSALSITFNLDTGQIDLISTNTSLPRFTRVVKGVSLEYVDIENDKRYTEGVCTVPYWRNGTCRPFSVRISDEHGNHMVVKVDALSGVRAIEYGKNE